MLKTLAVEEGHLAPTFVESWLQRHPEQPTTTSTVPLDELRASSLARRLLTNMVQDDKVSYNFHQLQKVVREARAKLMMVDSTFCIELAYIDQAQKLVDQRIEELIMDQLPSSTSWKPMLEAIFHL